MTYKACIDMYEMTCESLNKASFMVKYVVLEVSQKDAASFYAQMNQEMKPEIMDEVKRVMDGYLMDHIPIDYLLGYAYFYGYKLYVNTHVLIPRHETEELVEHALIIMDQLKGDIRVLDLGTGSGCIGLTIKKEMPHVHVTLSDISKDALAVVLENKKRLDVDVDLILSDWFENIEGVFDIIISNPPYLLMEEELGDTVFQEPSVALYGGKSGLHHYETILKHAYEHMHEKSYILFEHGYQQKDALQQLIKTYLNDVVVVTIKDMQGLDRITIATKKPNRIPFEGV
jgi:release factor glutamine methyltransferase